MLTNQSQYLVIGSGLTGLLASLRLANYGTVSLVTKGGLLNSNSALAQGGIAVSRTPDDSLRSHYQDTLRAGCYLNHPVHTKILINQSRAAFRTLLDLGLSFDQDPCSQELHLTKEGSHSYARIAHAGGDQTGKYICSFLANLVESQNNIHIFCDHTVTELLVDQGQCYGCQAIADQQSVTFHADQILLATGGYSGIYRENTSDLTCGGDGVAMAYRAGALIKDLELVQFHPTTLAHEKAHGFLISEALRGEGALLVNNHGEPFMANYHPLAELAPRDIVSRAINQEMQKSGHPHVYLDTSRLAQDFATRFPKIYDYCQHLKIDSCIPVKPGAHYSIGGVVTNSIGNTNIRRLWAAGEVAATGVHGANRLASNSLLECLVFSLRASHHMVTSTLHKKVKSEKQTYLTPKEASHSVDQQTLSDIEGQIDSITQRDLGIYRQPIQLGHAYDALQGIYHQLVESYVPTSAYYHVLNKATVAFLLAEAALNQTCSIGCHYLDKTNKRSSINAS